MAKYGTPVATRLSDDETPILDETAKKLDMSRAQLLKYLIQINMRLDPLVKEIIDHDCKKLNIKPTEFISNVIINYAAQQSAHMEAFRTVRGVFFPFVYKEDGEIVTGGELFDYLKERYLDDIIHDTDELDKQVEDLKEHREELLAKQRKKKKVTVK